MKNLIGKVNKQNTMKIVERGEYENYYYDVVGINTDYPYFDFTIYGKETREHLEELGFEDLPIIRKSWIELYKEAKEIPFVLGADNWYVFIYKGFGVSKDMDITSERPMKYISKEDAEYIVKNCKENNGGE